MLQYTAHAVFAAVPTPAVSVAAAFLRLGTSV
jgi:hypothetical protein